MKTVAVQLTCVCDLQAPTDRKVKTTSMQEEVRRTYHDSLQTLVSDLIICDQSNIVR